MIVKIKKGGRGKRGGKMVWDGKERKGKERKGKERKGTKLFHNHMPQRVSQGMVLIFEFE